MTKLVLKTTRYSGNHAFFVRMFKKMKKKMSKLLLFGGNSRNSGGDGGGDRLLNSINRGTGREKMAGELKELVPRVPLGIPSCAYSKKQLSFCHLLPILCFLLDERFCDKKETNFSLHC